MNTTSKLGNQSELQKDFESAQKFANDAMAWISTQPENVNQSWETFETEFVTGVMIAIGEVVITVINDCHVMDLKQVMIETNSRKDIYARLDGVFSANSEIQ